MKKILVFTIFVFLGINISIAQQQTMQVVENSFPQQKKGIVDDEDTAIKIAEVLWFAAYGRKIYKSRPFKGRLIKNDSVWLVEGTLNFDVGGVPFIEIQRYDCKVLRFGHGK